MFGYVLFNKPEMKFREYDEYRSYYCGLCRTLKTQHGCSSQAIVNYDMTFLILLLSGLYDNETNFSMSRCIMHPLKKQNFAQNIYSEYAADMSLLLAYYKAIDDWKDEKKLYSFLWMKLNKKKAMKIEKKYPHKAEVLKKSLDQISECEKRNETDCELVAKYFGNAYGEIFAMNDDEWSEQLHKVGFFLGKFIYLMDAYDDIEKDIKKNNYNPFKNIYGTEQFDEKCCRILTAMIAECSKAFEELPVLEHVDILRNILYSGVWSKYDTVKMKRENKRKKKNEKKSEKEALRD